MDGQIIKSQRAKVLVQALPYIQKYWNRVVVIKYGGHAMESEELKRQVMEDIVLLQLVGVKVVLVHGGGPEINDLLSKLGVKSEFVNGLRVTDEETAQIVQMVLAGKVGKSLVNLIESTGGKAMGICGIDGKLIEAKSKSPALGYVGDITRVNVGPINDLLEKGYIPDVSSLGCDDEGKVYNINADTMAAHKGGMIPKVESCIEALLCGVKKVFILDGRVPHSILLEMLTDEGSGTMMVGEKK